MVMSYCERKDAVVEDFEEFHDNLAYSVEQTLYATIGEAEYAKDYTQTDECCIYLNFALILLKQNENISFMKIRLLELIGSDKMEQYEIELQDEFIYFTQDIALLKDLLHDI